MSIGDFYRGDTKVFNLTFTRNGAVYSVENMSIWMTLKKTKTQADADAAMQVSVSLGAGSPYDAGLATITLTPANTNISPGKYYYDIQLVDATGSPVVVTTIVSSTVNVLDDITRDTS